MKQIFSQLVVRPLFSGVFLLIPCALADNSRPAADLQRIKDAAAVVAGPIAAGPVAATAQAIQAVPCPDWFRDAKFGIWSHWGPGCISGVDQNYAREMYHTPTPAYRYHVKHFGDPNVVGYKDILKYWTAEKWDPEGLMKLYKAAGAKYFVSMGRHHDNVDLYDSQYTYWNSVNIGPKKDVAGLWRQAALKAGLRFGLSFHPHSGYYREGMREKTQAGWKDHGPFDTGDPQYWSLYLPPEGTPGRDEEFSNGVYARIKDAIDKYQPDLLYFDGGLPGALGPKLMAHYFNSNMARHSGINEGLFTVKSDQSSVKDLERAEMKELTAQVWQCDTSESSWFYMDEPAAADELYTFHRSPTTMLHLLIDIVSKNGNLLMNIPQRADGTMDEHCEIMLAEFADWMKINGDAIFGTRPWGIYGEGPSELPRSNLNDLKSPMTSRDIRFTTKGNVLYAFVLGWPRDHRVTIRSLAKPAGTIAAINLLGCSETLDWKQTDNALEITLPSKKPCDHAITFKITGTHSGKLTPAPGSSMGVPSPSGR